MVSTSGAGRLPNTRSHRVDRGISGCHQRSTAPYARRVRGVIAGLVVIVAVATVLPAPPVEAQVAPGREVVALVINGTGNGHGRGLSQWGAYGRAVNGGQTWTQILDAYYGGTTLGSVATTSRVRVRLLAHDGDASVGVIST